MNAKAKELAKKLRPKWLLFANGVIDGKTQEKAYIDAGYKEKGARQAAQRLYTNVDIQDYIAAHQSEVAQALVNDKIATKVEIAEFHTACMRNDVTAIYVDKETNKIVLGEGANSIAIESVKFDKDTGAPVEVKNTSKLKAAEDLGKHLGYFETDNSQKQTAIQVNVAPVNPESLPPSDAIE